VYFLDQSAYDARLLQGVNTVDLQPKPALTIVDNSGAAPEASQPEAPAADEGHHVTSQSSTRQARTPGKPPSKRNAKGEYIANANTVVHDLNDPPPHRSSS
jgi:hypothetical protein